MSSNYPRVAQLRTVNDFRSRLTELGVQLPCDDDLISAANGSPLAAPLQLGRLTVGNRWCIHRWKAGTPIVTARRRELTLRRWARFGQSGAKLIWGGEAAAVRPDGRANPNQTLATANNEAGLRNLLETLKVAHREAGDSTDDLVVGLQLTIRDASANPPITNVFSRVSPITIHSWMPSSRSIPTTKRLCSRMLRLSN